MKSITKYFVVNGVVILLAGGVYYGEIQTTKDEEKIYEQRTIQGHDTQRGSSLEGESTAGTRTAGNVRGTAANEERAEPIQRRMGSRKADNEGMERRKHLAQKEVERERKRAEMAYSIIPSIYDDNRSYGYMGSFLITAYTAGFESTGKRPGDPGYGKTATGTDVTEGRTIAADWDVLPPGTIVQIEGLEGQYVVEDRGGGVKENHIDLYIPQLGKALEWGKKQRSVWVIRWGLPQ